MIGGVLLGSFLRHFLLLSDKKHLRFSWLAGSCQAFMLKRIHPPGQLRVSAESWGHPSHPQCSHAKVWFLLFFALTWFIYIKCAIVCLSSEPSSPKFRSLICSFSFTLCFLPAGGCFSLQAKGTVELVTMVTADTPRGHCGVPDTDGMNVASCCLLMFIDSWNKKNEEFSYKKDVNEGWEVTSSLLLTWTEPQLPGSI